MEVTYRKILVPLDGSLFAEQALPHAEYLAKGLNGQLVLMSCVEPYIVSLPAEPVVGAAYDITTDIDALEADRKQYLDGVQSTLKQKGISSEAVLRRGKADDEILDLAESESADLIIMTTHGRTGLLKLVYGSVAESVLHRSSQPVLLIRAKQSE